ncbi:MAG: RDD family protein [Burkholderiales bacterium]|nr:RDD family protein [Burkholderiales bacterium]
MNAPQATTDGAAAGVRPSAAGGWGRRIAARAIDALWQLPAAWLAWHGASAYSDLPWYWLALPAAIGAAAMQVVGDSLLVWTVGTTPGKAACGLRLRAPGGDAITLRQAVGRAVKVSVLGLGLWMPPWTAIDLAACLWRARRGHPMPWERGDASLAVAAAATPASTQATAWVLAGVVNLLSAAAWVLADGRPGPSGLSAAAAQDLRRAIAGHWLWIHPLTGTEQRLGARWRLVHEARFDRTQSYHASFAFGDGVANLVRLTLQWGHDRTDPCIDAELDLEERGFVVTRRHASPDGALPSCRAHGARLDDGRLVTGEVLIRVERDRLQTSVLRQVDDLDQEARREVGDLAAALAAPGDGWQLDAQGPTHFHWHNELTGRRQPLPATWTPHEIIVVPGASLFGHLFVRWPGASGSAEHKDAAAVFGLPRGVLRQAEVDSALQVLIDNARPERVERVAIDDRHERLRLVRAAGDGYIEVRRGRRHTWLLMWRHNESGNTPEHAKDHELLSPLLETLD